MPGETTCAPPGSRTKAVHCTTKHEADLRQAPNTSEQLPTRLCHAKGPLVPRILQGLSSHPLQLFWWESGLCLRSQPRWVLPSTEGATQERQGGDFPGTRRPHRSDAVTHTFPTVASPIATIPTVIVVCCKVTGALATVVVAKHPIAFQSWLSCPVIAQPHAALVIILIWCTITLLWLPSATIPVVLPPTPLARPIHTLPDALPPFPVFISRLGTLAFPTCFVLYLPGPPGPLCQKLEELGLPWLVLDPLQLVAVDGEESARSHRLHNPLWPDDGGRGPSLGVLLQLDCGESRAKWAAVPASATHASLMTRQGWPCQGSHAHRPGGERRRRG